MSIPGYFFTYLCSMRRHLHLFVSLFFLLPASVAAQQCDDLPWEANLTYQLNTQTSEGVRDASKVVSDALAPVTIGTPVALYLYGIMGLSESDGANRYAAESGLQLGVTVGVAYGLAYGLKVLIDRPRPYQEYPDCIVAGDSYSEPSMPSGHATGSAALATTLILRYPEWYVIAPTVLYALYTGFARLNLGMHYLSDVLVGYALGAGVALGVHALSSQLFDLADPILPGLTTTASFQMAPTHTPIIAFSYAF